MKLEIIILAINDSPQMNSKHPLALQPLGGKTLLWHTLENVKNLAPKTIMLAVDQAQEEIEALAGENVGLLAFSQQTGAVHALEQVRQSRKDSSALVLMMPVNMPLLSSETLQALVKNQMDNDGPITILADSQGEESRVYCFQADWLWQKVEQLSSAEAAGLNELVEQEFMQVLTAQDSAETLRVESRVDLAMAEAEIGQRINHKWMLAGVTLIDPQSTYIAAGVTLGRDTILYPNTILEGDTHIGEDCRIGPNTLVRSTKIGDRCEVLASVLEYATLEDEVDIGPFGHLRKGAHLADGVHMGNFGEVKNSYLGSGSKMGHFSYIGDATIGKDVNIGAGTITANYDGKNKHHTKIGDQAFIGSDTMLVAPLTIGKGAHTGAGSVVTKNVADDTTVVGMPARAIRRKSKESE